MIYTNTKVVKSTVRGIEKGYDIIAQQGGTYSGKTFGVTAGICIHAKTSKKPKKIRIIGQTIPHLKDGVLSDFETIISAMGGYEDHNSVDRKYRVGNCTIKFMSVDKIGKAKGPKFDITFVNEANYLDYSIIAQLMLRTDETFIIDWNPVSEFWFHEKLIKDKSKKILFKRSTYRDNPSVSEKKIRDIEALKNTDPELYKVYALGLTGSIQGLIFTNVKTIDSFPKDCKKIAYGLDFGFTNDPTALVKIGELHGQLYGEELIYETGLTNQDISKRLKEIGLSKRDEIISDSAEPKSIEELKRLGWNVKAAKKGKDSVRHGIDKLKSYNINLTRNSVNWRKESSNYKWKEKDGKSMNIPIDKYNHAWDAARYYASLKLSKRKSGYSLAKR